MALLENLLIQATVRESVADFISATVTAGCPFPSFARPVH